MKKFFFGILAASILIFPVFQNVYAIGICTGIESRYGRLDGTMLSSKNLQTGNTLTISGKIVSSTRSDMKGWFRIWTNSSTGSSWEVVSKEPPMYEINLSPGDVIPFSITIKAMSPGSYQISPQIYLGNFGSISLSDGCHTEPTVVVSGNPILSPSLSPLKQFESGAGAKEVKCKRDLQLVIKSEDGSPACVKPDTANILIERGWAANVANHGPWESFGPRTALEGNITNGTTQPLIPPAVTPSILLGSHHFNYTAELYAKVPNWNKKFVCYKYSGYAIQMTAKISNAVKFSGMVTDPNGVVHNVTPIALNGTLMQIQFSASSSDPDGSYSIAFNVVNGSNTSNVNFYCAGTEMVGPELPPALQAPPPK
ncbi:MAG: hypothetical protein ACREA7_08650 [Nitrosotalea sp.]